MANRLHRGTIAKASLTVAAADTTRLCRRAQDVHGLAETSAIALGRLMTVTALTGFIQPRRGTISMQVIAKRRIRQVFADVNERGEMRGYVRPPDFQLPRLPVADDSERLSIGAAIGEGILSVVQMGDDDQYYQSNTDLTHGELDLDAQHFFITSDQIPSVIRCDVLLGDNGRVRRAGGMLVQAMPGADVKRLEELDAELEPGVFTRQLVESKADPEALLAALVPDAVAHEEPVGLRWKCRCTHRRVLNAMRTFHIGELAEMINAGEVVPVTCDFCSKTYEVTTKELRDVFESLVTEEA